VKSRDVKRTTISEYSSYLKRIAGRTRPGRTRLRILDYSDLMQCLNDAREYGVGNKAGAVVANCYDWKALRMRMVAVKLTKNRGYAVRANWGGANKGSSRVPNGGQWQSWLTFADTLKKATLNTVLNYGYAILSATEVHKKLAEIRLQALKQAQAQWPDKPEYKNIQVTVTDSIAAGNCARVTAKVASWFGIRDRVLASELREVVLNREPTLARYAIAAIERART
jgi:hypothetical protein